MGIVGVGLKQEGLKRKALLNEVGPGHYRCISFARLSSPFHSQLLTGFVRVLSEAAPERLQSLASSWMMRVLNRTDGASSKPQQHPQFLEWYQEVGEMIGKLSSEHRNHLGESAPEFSHNAKSFLWILDFKTCCKSNV